MKDFKNGAATPRLELSSKFIFWESSPFVIEFHELLEATSFEDGVNVFFGPLEDNAGALDLPRLRCKFVNKKIHFRLSITSFGTLIGFLAKVP
jgi:hypothetical protein